MADLIFADSHNMVAYLEKSEDNADFAEIVDFLNASPIRYALTVSPTVYVSYIEQFWSTAKIKTVNNETQIRAKVDGKTIVITESSVRRDLHFNDEDGITCLTNTEIFENLQLMGYEKLSDKLTFYKSFFSPQWKYLIHTILQCLSSKSTAWNEFGTNIASAVICLAKKQKFNFSKLIFDGMLRNLDPNSKKFLMYPRFLQLFLNNQIENITIVFNYEYDTPSHTKKVFANMRRQGKDFLGTVTPLFATMLIQSQAVESEGSRQPTKSQHTPTTALPSHASVPTTLVADETVHGERGDSVERAATTATSLDAEQGSGVNTHGSDKERIKLKELMDMCTKLSDKVLDLENVKNAQALEIQKLKKIVKKLESKKKSRNPQLKRRLFKARIESSTEKSLGNPKDASKQRRNEIDQDEGISWFQYNSETQGRYGHDIGVNTASTSITTASINITTAEPVTTASAPITTTGVSVSTAEPSTHPITTTFIEDEDLTIAQTLMKMRSEKSKEKSKEKGVSRETATRLARGVIVKEASETATRPTVPPPQIDPKDKGKGIMQEPEKPVKVKGKDQIEYDADVAQRLQAELDEEARLEREREEEASKAANIAEWDDVQAMMDADYELAAKLQAEEQGEISIEERSKLFVELMNERKKHFARLRAEEQRRKPLTKAQKRNQMSNYLKNMAGYTLQQLRGYSFDEIKTLFETTMRKVNTFVPIKSEVERVVPELAAGSSKRDAEEELDQECSKRQKTNESSELAEEPRDKEADELSQEELQQIMIIVPEQGMNVEALQTKVHHVSIEKGIDIYMLVEKEYLLLRGTLTLMLVAKLLVDQDNKISRELLRKIFMQAERPRI
ncbi:hypothetical protein Tco_0848685 [Tanacetum coccineum]